MLGEVPFAEDATLAPDLLEQADTFGMAMNQYKCVLIPISQWCAVVMAAQCVGMNTNDDNGTMSFSPHFSMLYCCANFLQPPCPSC
jgi:hypothetical protein